MLETGRIGHVADHVIHLKVKCKRGAVGEARRKRREELIEFVLTVCVPERTEHAYGLVSRPKRPAGGCVAVVQRNLRFVQRGLDPGEKVFAVSQLGNYARSGVRAFAWASVPE